MIRSGWSEKNLARPMPDEPTVLLIRGDFTDDAAWGRLRDDIVSGANAPGSFDEEDVEPREDDLFDDLSFGMLCDVVLSKDICSGFYADRVTFHHPERPLLLFTASQLTFHELSEPRPNENLGITKLAPLEFQCLRVVPAWVAHYAVMLKLGEDGIEDMISRVDKDGLLRR